VTPRVTGRQDGLRTFPVVEYFDVLADRALVLHIALEVEDVQTLMSYKEKAAEVGVEVRGPSDHGFVQSILPTRSRWLRYRIDRQDGRR
jgi:hypothetical protein